MSDIKDFEIERTLYRKATGNGSRKPPVVVTTTGPSPRGRIERIEYLLGETFKELSLLKSELK